jgi:regulator of sigma E protease
MALSVGSFFVFVVVLGVLVFVHEFGHFITSKWLGVHVEEFAFGFPPRLVGIVKDAQGKWRVFWGQKAPKPEELGGPSTIYSLNWIPVGGFVRPQGEDNPNVPGGLAAAPKKVRLIIMAAGAAFNLIFALLIFTVGFHLGWPEQVYVNAVAANSPAAAAGLQVNDVIVRANGADIHHTDELSQIIYASLGTPVTLVLQRSGQTVDATITPRTQPPAGEGPIGISMAQNLATLTSYSWPQAGVRAAEEIYYQFDQLIHLPGRLLRREVPVEIARPVGLVGMNDMTRLAVQASEQANALYPLLDLIGAISVALAITNLLPLPALDGGRIVFVLIEAVRGRRVDPAQEGMIHMAGLLALLILMAVITYQDIFFPIVPR